MADLMLNGKWILLNGKQITLKTDTVYTVEVRLVAVRSPATKIISAVTPVSQIRSR